jgi:DNA-binding transcriptional MocR family regulator
LAVNGIQNADKSGVCGAFAVMGGPEQEEKKSGVAGTVGSTPRAGHVQWAEKCRTVLARNMQLCWFWRMVAAIRCCTALLAMTAFPLPLERDRASAGTLVAQLVAGIRAAIAERRLLRGARLPSVRELARQHGISTFTVTEAYRQLVSQGVLSARRGAGYQVCDPGTPRRDTAPAWAPPQLDADWLLSEVYADQSVPIKAGCGWLPGEWVIEPGLRHALRAVSRLPAEQFGDYGHPFGHAALRGRIALDLQRHGLPVDEGRVLLTQGATQALDLVTRLLLRPGDTVVVEDPCYCNLLPILRLAQVRVVGVPRTPDGLDLEALEQMVRQHHPKALFMTPALHNPTGSSLSLPMAFRILQIAERGGLWIVEDDVNRELAPAATPMLAAMEGLRRVIYLGSFTKTISPALRVGYLAAEPSVLTELARIKMAIGLTSSSVAEKVVLRVLAEGQYARHVAQLRQRLSQAHARVAERLLAAGAQLFHQPGAGLFLWARLPIEPARAAALTTQALQHGIWLAPGSYFCPDGRPSAWFRFNVAYADSPPLWTFLGSRRG